MYRKCFSIIISVIVISSSCTKNNGWQQQNINIKLHDLFPNADTIKLLNTQEAAADISDSILLPTPLYKAFIKERSAINYDFIFYFYELDLKDPMFTKLLRQISIHDLKTAFGTKKAEYISRFPQFDSTNGNKIVVYAISLINNRDSIYRANKEKEILKTFGLTRHKENNLNIR